MSGPRTYFAIDLKSYYASAECAARGLDPLTTNLVVADARVYLKTQKRPKSVKKTRKRHKRILS